MPADRARAHAGMDRARRPAARGDLRRPRHRRKGRDDQADHGAPERARTLRVVALGTPTERERTQWYFQRYIPHLPAAGEIVLFDRSWYNRAGVEQVMGFCTEEEYAEFLRTCPMLERALVRSGIILIKYWLSIERRGAGTPVHRAHRQSRQALEAQPDGPARPARTGSTTPRPRTRCSRSPTSTKRRGTS